jgi:hypothetical protein
MAPASDDGPAFRLLSVEYALFLRRANSSNKLAMRLVQRFLEEGERDDDGRIRYKLWEGTALPGGLTPSPYDGDFWRSYPERGIRCDIKPWDSAAHWTGPASATWKEFDGRQSADYEVLGIKLNHVVVLEFLESAGMPKWVQSNAEKGPELSPSSEPASSSPAADTDAGTAADAGQSRLQQMYRDGHFRGREQKRIYTWACAGYPPHGDLPEELEAPEMADKIEEWRALVAKAEGKKPPKPLNRDNLRRRCRELLKVYRQKPAS